MPRTKRNSDSRHSRNWGVVSGVTIVTLGSGVTITKNGVQTDEGYQWSNPSANNQKLVSGVTAGGGVSHYMTAAGLGLVTITNLMPSAMPSAVTEITFNVEIAEDKGGVTVWYFDQKSVAFGGATLNYIAIGT